MEIETFQRDGFVILPGLFPADEMARTKAEAKRLLAEHPAPNGVLVGMAALSPVFRELARDERLCNALEPLLGPDIEFLSDKIVYKAADVTFGSPWHQDWPYWKGAHKLSVWIALDQVTPENGALKLLPGTHKSLALHDGSDTEGIGFGNRLRPESVDESQAVTVSCAPGDAVIFHDLLLHASHPNISGQDRWSLISTYRSAAEPDLLYEWAVAAEIVRGKIRPAKV